ncbi:hypothetical protein L1049_009654 [Liquidambar formosana]|uniref:Protein kinase domain-containing protein n=1 Tax=Liquidambar formosana TaxID=63359 RepID=A0AAP0N7T6_LIQFO
MEYAPGGTLIDAIRERGGGCLEEATIRSYARDMLHGLRGSNVLITNDGVKIADLGCAKRVDEVSAVNSTLTGPIAGTPLFMAPEVARGEQQGFPADVWALGCTVIEMATGRAPWADVSDPVSALYRIGFSGDVPEIPESLSKQAKDFLGKCLKRDPGERWSASELVKHAFLEEPNFTSKEIYGSNSDTPTCVLDQGFWDSNGGMGNNPEFDPLEFFLGFSKGKNPAVEWRCFDGSSDGTQLGMGRELGHGEKQWHQRRQPGI